MESFLCAFPEHICEGYERGKEAVSKPYAGSLKVLLFCGIGGSGISGRILERLLMSSLPIPFLVISSPPLPPWVGEETLCMVATYSGNTEETLALAREARKRKARLLLLSQGGALAREREEEDLFVCLPGGLQPRFALGYMLGGLLGALEMLFPSLSFRQDLEETQKYLKATLPTYATSESLPCRLAQEIASAIPVFIGIEHYTDFAAWRCKTQCNENAKHVAFASTLPEAMHNEIVGFFHPDSLPLVFCALHDPEEPLFCTTMARAYLRHVAKRKMKTFEVWAEGKSPLCRALSLVAFGDWLSLHLARIHAEDPGRIPAITHLKRFFKKLECGFEGGEKI
ncbi:MAG: SIS domain-containing protein [Candidatus Caldatribacterium sp.]|nr:SIS domain-containing protein [Candidatus Caldatribacterium sp.]